MKLLRLVVAKNYAERFWSFTSVISGLALVISPISSPCQIGQTSKDSSVQQGSSDLILVTSEAEDRYRSKQLVQGVERGESLLLRSPSSLSPAAGATTASFSRIRPQFLWVINSALPFSQNYDGMWAGRGLSTRTLSGFRIDGPRGRLIFAPELIVSANAQWPLFHDFYVPPVPAGKSPFYFPYYTDSLTIDLPMRFGDKAIRRLDLGQTTALLNAGKMEIGFSNENEWWGPGIRNAILLSNNAPGFPHLFLRTGKPLNTKLGAVEVRWLVGGLTESAFFDTVSDNNTRSLAAIATTLQSGWDPNLTVGFARAVYGTTKSWGPVFFRWFDVLRRTHDEVVDTSRTQRDQLFTLFGRWVFPSNGVELYGEWGRTRLQPSWREFLVSPNHSQAYTVGMQWRGGDWRSGTFRVQSEITSLEQSADFRNVATGFWYTSPRVTQGYTNRGEALGASIGPGSSSQWLAVDYLKPDWRIGTFFGRIRWNQDAHNHYPFPIYVAYCNFDVSLYPGVRAAKVGGFGALAAEMSFQNRLTPFFQNGGGCPNNGRRLDIRNTTLSISFAPFQR